MTTFDRIYVANTYIMLNKMVMARDTGPHSMVVYVAGGGEVVLEDPRDVQRIRGILNPVTVYAPEKR